MLIFLLFSTEYFWILTVSMKFTGNKVILTLPLSERLSSAKIVWIGVQLVSAMAAVFLARRVVNEYRTLYCICFILYIIYIYYVPKTQKIFLMHIIFWMVIFYNLMFYTSKVSWIKKNHPFEIIKYHTSFDKLIFAYKAYLTYLDFSANVKSNSQKVFKTNLNMDLK